MGLAAFLKYAGGFDAVIDVRSPAEFALDHVPGAVNMPVLSDVERARVGTIYTRDSPFAARKIGAALVARNVAAHVENALMGQEGGWHPLVYCWRGGQRSGSFATILRQIGWRVEVLEGGYRSYRRQVVEMLYDQPLAHRLIRLDGNTGSAKTDLLARLAARGVQVVDLEGLAGHRGSILGEMAGPQPSQKAFESALAQAVCAADQNRVLLVEAESSRIGALRLPPSLWAGMRAAPRLVVAAPVAARARYLAEIYAGYASDLPCLTARLDHLRPLAGHEQVDHWIALAQEGQLQALAAGLIKGHYDPAYTRARAADTTQIIDRFETDNLDETAREVLADRLAARLRQV
ncbi:tRNA 2-selenouridine(34) synthase MnmH [Rhodophyticola sp. CCM32]|uniref:tRNA 2-selenouridine(34) synthase MnmH n=1 Tax=Rhodophyticola sp. CCM32 TaxID=2916397 RepID=UPI00107F8B95|nr:tRNA 2-selenouridine(34) synthase MnmH [Rhodophyticola sp. CCM32]QBY00852.1 tRNA 2-selenouridine(34) synthase MnmH [Rhodophyticola sp. CCM32]